LGAIFGFTLEESISGGEGSIRLGLDLG